MAERFVVGEARARAKWASRLAFATIASNLPPCRATLAISCGLASRSDGGTPF
jgi:hypothetical protein